jgi:Fe-S cluster assembly iron-binding protein IscA
MLSFTRSASRHVADVRARCGVRRQSARLRRDRGRVQLTFTETPVFDDQRIDANGVTVLVESCLVPALRDATIDARPTAGGEVLVIVGPSPTPGGAARSETSMTAPSSHQGSRR